MNVKSSRRLRVVLLVATSAAILVVAGVLLVHALSYGPSPADAYLDDIHPAGYQRVDTDSSLFDGGSASTGVFIGPAVSDAGLIKVISAPGLEMRTTGLGYLGISDLPDARFGFVALEYSPASGCSVTVVSFKPKGTVGAGWKLSAQQSSQVRAGRSTIFEAQVSCGPG